MLILDNINYTLISEPSQGWWASQPDRPFYSHKTPLRATVGDSDCATTTPYAFAAPSPCLLSSKHIELRI